MSTEHLEFCQLQSVINFCVCTVANWNNFICQFKVHLEKKEGSAAALLRLLMKLSHTVKQEKMTFNQVHIHFAFRKLLRMCRNWIPTSYPGLVFPKILCMSSIQSQVLFWNFIEIPSIFVNLVLNSRQIAQRILYE